jgi:hypothetical protein
MSTITNTTGADSHFVAGNRCLLLVLDQRFLVGVLQVTADTIRTSFPLRDFPVEGMYVSLEFHDEQGYTRYDSEVLSPPRKVGDGLLLKRPQDQERNCHRGAWRLEMEIQANVKSHVHPRRKDATIVDISAGGALLSTEAALEIEENFDLTFILPQHEPMTMTSRVVHVPETQKTERALGVKFVSPDPVNVQSISKYIRAQLRHLHGKSPTS